MTLFADELKRNLPTLYNLNKIGDMKHCRNCDNFFFSSNVFLASPQPSLKLATVLRNNKFAYPLGKTNRKCKFCPFNLDSVLLFFHYWKVTYSSF